MGGVLGIVFLITFYHSVVVVIGIIVIILITVIIMTVFINIVLYIIY